MKDSVHSLHAKFNYNRWKQDLQKTQEEENKQHLVQQPVSRQDAPQIQANFTKERLISDVSGDQDSSVVSNDLREEVNRYWPKSTAKGTIDPRLSGSQNMTIEEI